ncbi:50S ribosomal protein L10 [Thermoproteus tenax]|uniref:Large ribosomal subunit protein uL10 n=1 Tax=Thermoproteus tenax (strain ATCC 35583 / DSM 2078 / JCM 9277 / NBRC 100435 / Kra 1) TaxID=768679 RepID=G4RLI0_THETK|nr:50S ribosomal protein L10 [Thermoproteus tenax]CCC82425.1 50S ribosomal protein L10e [Thermoproteus tenax Kra 1]
MSSVQQAAKRAYSRTRPYPQNKTRILSELEELVKHYNYIFLFDLHELSSRILHEYRYRLRGRAVIKVAKHNLMRLALRRVYGEVPPEVDKELFGERAYIFTNENPALFVRIVEANAVRRKARGGDVAPYDIIAPAGPTNLSPGPILSKFGKLKIPTRVQEGKIWIAKDSPVVKAGQQITDEIADILRVLGVEPIYEKLRLLGIIWRGSRFVSIEEVSIDVKKYTEMVQQAAAAARNLALNVVYPTPEVLSAVIPAAHMRAVALAVKLGIVSKETLPALLARASAEAAALAAVIAPKVPDLGIQVAQQSQVQQAEQKAEGEKKEEKAEEGEKGPSEEDIASGLASLF